MKSKTAKTILISTLISLGLIAAISAVILFVLIPQGIVTQEWLYHFFISAIPAIAVALLLAIALLWIEHSIYVSKAELLDYDGEAIEPGSYDESLHNMPYDSDYSSAFESSSVPNDWEYVEELDSLPKKEQDQIQQNIPETNAYEPIPEVSGGEKTLPPFGEFDFDLPTTPIKLKDLSAATGCVAFEWNKDTMSRPEAEKYIAPTKEQIEKGEFVMHLAPSKASDYEVDPSDAFNALSSKFPKVLHEFGEFIFDIPTAKAKKELSAAKGLVDFTWNKDTMKRPTGEMYIAPTEEQIARGEFAFALSPVKQKAEKKAEAKQPEKELSAAKGTVDFAWNKDTMKRPDGEMYIAPTEEQIAKGEFAFALSPVKQMESAEAIQTESSETDTSFNALPTLDNTLKAGYDISAKTSEELESDGYVISYEKDSDANIAYPTLPLPEDVKGGFDTEEIKAEEQANEIGEYTGDLYKASTLPEDGVNTNDAYDYLSVPYSEGKNSLANIAYPTLPLSEDVKGGFDTEEIKAEEQAYEIGEYTGDLYKVSSLPESDVDTNTAYDYLCIPYGEEKTPLTAATGVVNFAWNKDTMARPLGEMYIAPTEEQIAKGEFAFALSPITATTALAHRTPSDVAVVDTSKKELQEINTVSNAYDKLSYPEDVEEGYDEETAVSSATESKESAKPIYVPNGKVQDGANHSDAYNALMTTAPKSGTPESFSEEFRSILDLEMESARLLKYELTIARITSDKVDEIMALDFEALAFKESENRICMIFQCQNKTEATELLNMIKEVINDKSMRIRMSELRGRNIDSEAFAKEVLR